MSDRLSVVFLGVNDAGMRIYEWLCDRPTVDVCALLTTREQLSLVEELRPDVLLSVGYRHRVPESILDIPERAALNLHPAYLPFNRGANPNVWAIVDGTPAGVTLHHMAPELDTGAIVERRTVPTDFADTGRALYDRLEDAQFDLFTDVWPRFERGETSADPQSRDAGTYHETDEFDALCDLDATATYTTKELLDILRALTFPPHRNATVEVDGERYYVEVDITRADD